MSNLPLIVANTSAGLPVGAAEDSILLVGVQSPGLWKIQSCEATQAWDIKEGYGFSYATVVPKGEKLSEPEFLVEIWEGLVQDPAWVSFCTQFLTRATYSIGGTVASKAMSYAHLSTSRPPFNITNVLFQGVALAGRGEGGSFLYRVKFLEYRQPIAAPPFPTQGTPPNPTGPPPAEDALGQEQNDVSAKLAGDYESFSALQ